MSRPEYSHRFHEVSGVIKSHWVDGTSSILANYPGLIVEIDPVLKHHAMDEHFENVGISVLAVGRAESSASHPCHFIVGEGISGRGQLKCDGTRAETRFILSAKRTRPFKSEGASVQSITGSRVVRISDSNVRYTMFRGSVKGTGYPFHSPVSLSLSLPCVTVCRHISTGVYLLNRRLSRTEPIRAFLRREICCSSRGSNRHSFFVQPVT